ncbi:hypothetical protein MIND_01271800 [Mycena indigotica]|uniref:Uncharacterized protein n=1 Tax=Mycena indigotica TaxID=2126181 RepID=A0A8H6S4R0_9AGAR|nr:uncharacterized protein MIND_01271800 [Mycena indigotica]KAF7291280.1 hypothetical protein MIND_01271800 [Mycena indigotica]
MTDNPPRLPPELERAIFELVAEVYPRTRSSLAHVAARVRTWIEPWLYRTLILRDKLTSERLLSLSHSKPADFFRHSVRRIIIGRKAYRPADILALAPDTTHIAIGTTVDFGPIFAAFGRLRHVHTVSMDSTTMSLANMAHPVLPVWATLTHLELINQWAFQDSNIFTFVVGLPALTHLALFNPDWMNTQRLLEDSNAKLCALVIQCHREADGYSIARNVVPLILNDPRVVVCQRIRWDEGAREGLNFWMIADAFLKQKQNGEVDGALMRLALASNLRLFLLQPLFFLPDDRDMPEKGKSESESD